MIEDRVLHLEQHVADLRVRAAHLEDAIKANTAVTEAIKQDTSEMVALMKGGRALGSMMKWIGMVAAGVAVWKGWIFKW